MVAPTLGHDCTLIQLFHPHFFASVRTIALDCIVLACVGEWRLPLTGMPIIACIHAAHCHPPDPRQTLGEVASLRLQIDDAVAHRPLFEACRNSWAASSTAQPRLVLGRFPQALSL